MVRLRFLQEQLSHRCDKDICTDLISYDQKNRKMARWNERDDGVSELSVGVG